MRKVLLWGALGVLVLSAALMFRSSGEPDIYRLEKRGDVEAQEAVRVVRAACEAFPLIGGAGVLKQYALVTDEEPVKRFLAAFGGMGTPDFERAEVFSPVARQGVFYVEFPTAGGPRHRVIVELFQKRLVLRECVALE